MQEFTLRNKTTRPIMTLKPAMLAIMLAARPESVSLVLAKKVQDYKDLTGKTLSLDYDQQQALLAHAGADSRGMWAGQYSQMPYTLFQIKSIFTDGFLRRSMSGSMAEDLALVEAFHALLDTQLAETASGKAGN